MELISQVTIDDSVYLATDLIELASRKEKLSDKRRKSQFSRLLNNSKTLQTTMHLTDEVMRISSSKASGKILRNINQKVTCLLYTSPSPRDATLSRMPSSA